MAKPNLDKLSVRELEDLQAEIEHVLAQRKEMERVALKKEMELMAARKGYSLDELFGKVRGKKHSLPPKYRNPDNFSETWSGRGRKPKWVVDKLKSGASLDDLRIIK